MACMSHGGRVSRPTDRVESTKTTTTINPIYKYIYIHLLYIYEEDECPKVALYETF